MGCPVARRLLKEYHRATLAAREAAEVLFTGISSQDSRRSVATDVMTSANRAAIEAQQAYWDHVRQHRCHNAQAKRAEGPVLESLRLDICRARDVFDRAMEQCQYLSDISADAKDSPDGGLAFARAHKVRAQAFGVYYESLRRYLNATMNVEFPLVNPVQESKPN